MLYIVKGKNGAGKTFLTDRLFKLGYKKSVSYTTRLPRDNEQDEYDYHFTSKEQFERLIRDDFFAEYQSRGNTYYGTPRSNLTDGTILISSDEKEIGKYYHGGISLIYIDSSLATRYRRVKERGISDLELFERFNSENSSFLYNFDGTFIDNEQDDDFALKQLISCFEDPKQSTNNDFLKKQVRVHNQSISDDEMLDFLQFEEYLLRVLYLDKKVKEHEIERIYGEYIQRFSKRRGIKFEILESGENHVVLNGNVYRYRLKTEKIKKGENKENEKEIN